MGKLDGMDPKLVRDLLSEVRQAAEQMRTAEGRVARLMSAAGLSSQSTHRPSQVADACEEMVRDVSARVELLERKVKQEGASQPGPKIGEPKAETPKVADARGEAPQAEETKAEETKDKDAKAEETKDKDAKAETPKVADARGEASKTETPKAGTSHDSGARPDTPKAEDLKPAVRPEGGGQHDGGQQGGGQQGGGQSAGNAPEDGRKPHSPPDAKPDIGSDPKPDSKPENGSKGEETSPRDGHSGSDGSKDRGADSGGSGKDTDAKAHPSARNDADPKGDTGSKGDERSPRDGHSGSDGSKDRGADSGGPGKDVDAKGHSSAKVDADLKGDTGSKGDETSPRGDGKIEILDTFRNDHPDDIDQTGGPRPQVVEVHGVKMLQIPLDSPSAAEVGELLKHVEDLPLLDDPSVATSADLLTDGGSGVDGAGSDRPGQVEPNEALKSVKPAFPVPDTAEPALDQGGRPPGTGGETVSPLVGTPFDDTGTHSAGTHSGGTHSTGTHSTGGTHVTGGTAEGVLTQWAEDGDAGSAQSGPVSPDASGTFADSGYRAGPPDGTDVLLRAGETGDEGVWSTADAGSGDAADDVDSGDPPRSAPPSGGDRPGGTE